VIAATAVAATAVAATVVAALASCALFSAGAAAQPYAGPAAPGSRIMPPFEAVSIAHSEGLNVISRPVLRGRTYVLTAFDRSGRAVRVAIDAVRGDVVAIQSATPAPYAGYARGWSRFELDGSVRRSPRGPMPAERDSEPNAPRPAAGMPAAPVPPAAAVPSASTVPLGTMPLERAAVALPRTPLPRSRPADGGRAANPPTTVMPAAPETSSASPVTLKRQPSAEPPAAETTGTVRPPAVKPVAQPPATIAPVALKPASIAAPPVTRPATGRRAEKPGIAPADRPSAQTSPTDTPVQGFE
jgi:hypothetical protein